MPIRFRCGHCNQLLGIARRKAGTVVNCPRCQRAIIVPQVEEAVESNVEPPRTIGPPSAAAEQPTQKPTAGGPIEDFVFERSDFDELFRPILNPRSVGKGVVAQPNAPARQAAVPVSAHVASVPEAIPVLPSDAQPPHIADAVVPVPPSVAVAQASPIVLTQTKLMLLLALVLGGLIFAFGGGVLLGMFMARS